MNPEIKEEISKAIKENVNGKIDSLRDEMRIANEEQNKKIDELMQVFRDTSAFFKVSVKIAQFIIPIGAALGTVYGLLMWFRNK